MSIGALLNRFRGGAAASGATSTAAAAAASKPSIFGRVGRCIKNNKLQTAFLAMSVIPALAYYKSEYNSDAEKVEGINWSSGNKAVSKALLKYLGFGLSTGLAGLACGASMTLGAPIAIGLMAFGWCALPGLLEKIFPDEGEVIKKACEKKEIAYNPPSITSSFMGSPSSPEGVMA